MTSQKQEKTDLTENTEGVAESQPVSATPPSSGTTLDKTLRMGSAFSATWRMPAIVTPNKASEATTHESGVRKLDQLDPKRGDTLDLGRLLQGGNSPAPGEAAHRARRINTLRPMDSPLPPPPSDQQGLLPTETMVEVVKPAAIQADQPPPAVDGERHTNPRWPRRQRRAAEVLAPEPGPQPQSGAELPRPAAPHPAHHRREFASPALETTLRTKAVPGRRKALPTVYIAAGLASAVITAAVIALWPTDPVQEQDTVVLQDAVSPRPGQAVKATASSLDPALEATPGRPTNVVAPARTTTLVTEPSGAEVVFRGAVVANSPAQVVRPEFEEDYLVRKAGFKPQLVRIGPGSPDKIELSLRPEAPSESPPQPRPGS